MQLTDQKKGTLLAFIAIMFITPDSLLIRLSSIESWGLIFYRGIIPFFAVFIPIFRAVLTPLWDCLIGLILG